MRAVLKPSQALISILIMAHSLAIVAILSAALPIGLWAVILAAILVSLWFSLRVAMLKNAEAAVTLAAAEEGTLNTQDSRGNWRVWTVLGSTYVAGFLVVLNLRSTDQPITRHVTILPDAIDAESFRKLRIWLRWKAASNLMKLEDINGV